MGCCVNCFSNPFIIKWIQENGDIDECGYCGSENAEVVAVEDIGDFIRECLSKAYANATTDDIPYHVYERMDAVYTIDEILRWDEEIFSLNLEDQGKAEGLLSDLMSESGPSWHDIAQGDNDEFEGGDAYLFLRDSFYAPDHNQYQYDWEDFTYIVKHVNRFFDVTGTRTREELLKKFDPFIDLMAKELPIGYRIWRGRLVPPNGSYGTISQQLKECGPPPRKMAVSLRMSPSGISYFYGAEDFETAYKEIRASQDNTAIYGLFETTRILRIVDLSHIPHVTISSIFSPDYEHELHAVKYFLRSFTNEISKPILPNEAQIEYLPTQILTEYIRSKGYDGVRYGSSLTDGFNLTLFCGPPEGGHEDEWIVKKLQIPMFTDWLSLIDFRMET